MFSAGNLTFFSLLCAAEGGRAIIRPSPLTAKQEKVDEKRFISRIFTRVLYLSWGEIKIIQFVQQRRWNTKNKFFSAQLFPIIVNSTFHLRPGPGSNEYRFTFKFSNIKEEKTKKNEECWWWAVKREFPFQSFSEIQFWKENVRNLRISAGLQKATETVGTQLWNHSWITWSPDTSRCWPSVPSIPMYSILCWIKSAGVSLWEQI